MMRQVTEFRKSEEDSAVRLKEWRLMFKQDSQPANLPSLHPCIQLLIRQHLLRTCQDTARCWSYWANTTNTDPVLITCGCVYLEAAGPGALRRSTYDQGISGGYNVWGSQGVRKGFLGKVTFQLEFEGQL